MKKGETGVSTYIYYFTATGNSLYIAKMLGNIIPDSKIISILQSNKKEETSLEADKIGFVFPLYYGGIPRVLEQFIKNLEIKGHPEIFAVATRGSSTGMVKSQINKLMLPKKVQLNYLTYINMPSNYVRLYDMKEKQENKSIRLNAKDEAIKAAHEIERGINKVENDSMIANLIYKPMYKFWKKSLRRKDNKFTINDDCNRCGTCVKICPVNNIILDDGNPKWLHNCEDCMACIHICPKKAINIGRRTQQRRRYRNPFIDVKEIIDQKITKENVID